MPDTNDDRPAGLVPHLLVDGAAAAIEFYKKAFGATEVMRMAASDGKRLMHAQLRIGSAMLYLCDEFPEFNKMDFHNPKVHKSTTVVIHQYVPDVDAAIKRCADAGATVTMPAMDQFWGDRYGIVTDPFGHMWSLATPLKK